jgi:hypothetical protein
MITPVRTYEFRRGIPKAISKRWGNIYKTFISAVAVKKAGGTPSAEQLDFPTPLDGAKGVKFIEKCVESSEKNSQWVQY